MQTKNSSKKIYELGLILPEQDKNLEYTFYKRSFIYTHEEFKKKSFLTASGNTFSFSKDQIHLDLHFSTHIDALCHCCEYTSNSKIGHSMGAESIPLFYEKAIIIDVAKYLGVAALHSDLEIDVKLLQHACDKDKVEIGIDAKIVLIRTGHISHRLMGDYAQYYKSSPGINLEAANFLRQKGIKAVGADNFAIEKIPCALGDFYPVHRCLLVESKIFLIENLNLEELSANSVKKCTFISAPIRVFNGTAAIVNPIAICE